MSLVTTLTQADQSHPPLVLIHGLGSAATVFKPIIPALSKSFRVITVDLPGHGQSPYNKGQAMDPKSLGRAIFETVEREYGVKEFHVAGNSLGGWIALEMAADQPQRIKTLTGLAPAGLWLKPASGRTPSEAWSYYLAKVLRPVIRAGLHVIALRKIGYSNVSPKWKELSYEICSDSAYAMGHAKGYFPAWDGMLGRRFEAHIPENVPVTILFGDTDNTLPYPHSQERSLAPAHASWIVVDNCGHAPMWDYPELMVKIISQTSGQ
jgi:pimeloyl-ACP methyl ester carboxylesterase